MPQETIKNIPLENPQQLAALIKAKPHQVVSMALSNSDHIDMAVFSFADGEMVSEEEYLGTTMYYLLEGETKITRGGKEERLKAGDVLAVPANTLHAVGGLTAFTMLQITIRQ